MKKRHERTANATPGAGKGFCPRDGYQTRYGWRVEARTVRTNWRPPGFFSGPPPPVRINREAQRSSAGAKGAWKVSGVSTAVLQGPLERAVTGDAEWWRRLTTERIRRARGAHRYRRVVSTAGRPSLGAGGTVSRGRGRTTRAEVDLSGKGRPAVRREDRRVCHPPRGRSQSIRSVT